MRRPQGDPAWLRNPPSYRVLVTACLELAGWWQGTSEVPQVTDEQTKTPTADHLASVNLATNHSF